MYVKPCERSESFVPFSVVDDRENRPDVKPITLDVELPYVCEVNSNGTPPRDESDRHVLLIAKHPPERFRPTFEVEVA